MRGAEVARCCAETAALLGGTAVGRRHPGLRAGRAPRASSSTCVRAHHAAGRADRRRPARPGGAARGPRHRHLPARAVAGPARPVPARRARGGSCSRAASAAATSGRARASCCGSSRSRGCSRIPRPPSSSVLFAGGIHDARSAAMVAAMAAPLAARGAKVGVLMGTAYLFTARPSPPARSSPRSSRRRSRASDTVLLETAPGPRHPLRRHRVRRGVRAREARASRPTACRRRRCGGARAAQPRPAAHRREGAAAARATRSCASTPTCSAARACT